MRSRALELGLLLVAFCVPATTAKQKTTNTEAPPPTSAPKVEQRAVQDPEEYAVWSTVLANKYVGESVKELFIEDRTDIDLPQPDMLNRLLTDYENSSQALSDLKSKNDEGYVLENKFNLKVPYTLISSETEKSIFPPRPKGAVGPEYANNMHLAWEQFYKLHPGASGIITLSRIGFNSDKTLAIAYVVIRASLMLVRARSYLLVKKNASWEIEKSTLIWFS